MAAGYQSCQPVYGNHVLWFLWGGGKTGAGVFLLYRSQHALAGKLYGITQTSEGKVLGLSGFYGKGASGDRGGSRFAGDLCTGENHRPVYHKRCAGGDGKAGPEKRQGGEIREKGVEKTG